MLLSRQRSTFIRTFLPSLTIAAVAPCQQLLDRAPYHTSVTDETKTPQSGWKKDELVRYILEHDQQNQYTEQMLLNEEHVVEIEGEDGIYILYIYII